MTEPSLEPLAHHEMAHALAAEALGLAAAPYLWKTGGGTTFVGADDGGEIPREAWRVICAAGPVAELRHRFGRPLTPRGVWHAWTSGDLPGYCTPSDLKGMHPVTRGLLTRAAEIVHANWPDIERMAASLIRLGTADREEVLLARAKRGGESEKS